MTHTAIWKKLCALVVICASVQLSGVARSDAAGGHFDKFPVVISCEYNGMFHAFYLSRVTPEGMATYISSGRLAGTISLDGQAEAVGGSNGGSCLGKTLDQLRASGQAHFLKP